MTENGFIESARRQILDRIAVMNIVLLGVLTILYRTTRPSQSNDSNKNTINDQNLQLSEPKKGTKLNLSQFKHSKCDLSKIITENPNITEIDAGDCDDLSDNDLELLTSLKNLTHLNLAGCIKITDTGLGHLTAFKKLQRLSLQNCIEITGTGLERLTTLTNLQYLNLTNCKKITSVRIGNLMTIFPNLRIYHSSGHYQGNESPWL